MSVPGGENADKVKNIVLGQKDEFRRLYAGLVRSMGTMKIEERTKDRYNLEVSLEIEVDLKLGFWKVCPLTTFILIFLSVDFHSKTSHLQHEQLTQPNSPRP